MEIVLYLSPSVYQEISLHTPAGITNTLGPGFQPGVMDVKAWLIFPEFSWPPFYLTFIQNQPE